MAIGDVHKELRGLLGDIALWVVCVKAPIRTALSILGSDLSEEKKLVRALRVWLIAFLLSLAIQLPMYKSAGIAWHEVEFHAPAALYQLLVLFSMAAATHFALRLYRVRSDLGETLVLYAVIVGTYTPLAILLNYSGMAKLVATFQLVKPLDLSPLEVIRRLLAEMRTTSTGFVDTMMLGISPFLTFIGVLVLAAYARGLARWYRCDEARAVRALAFAGGVLVLPAFFVLWLFFGYILYVYAGGA